MLMPSHRHTSRDLALWRDYEEADFASSVRDQVVGRSVDLIRSEQIDYVGTSWGKDSVVMLDMMIRAGRLDLPVVWVRLGVRDNPDCEAVRDAFLSRWGLDYHERHFRYEDCSKGEHWRAVDAEFGPRRMTGLRGDESSVRRMSMSYFGLATKRSVRPLGDWRGQEVFSWCACKDLPLHAAYGMLGGGRYAREHLRTHSIGGQSGRGNGRGEWEGEYYPDVLAMIGRSSS